MDYIEEVVAERLQVIVVDGEGENRSFSLSNLVPGVSPTHRKDAAENLAQLCDDYVSSDARVIKTCAFAPDV